MKKTTIAMLALALCACERTSPPTMEQAEREESLRLQQQILRETRNTNWELRHQRIQQSFNH